MGAPWLAERTTKNPAMLTSDFDLGKRKREHWAWRPLQPRSSPRVKDCTWPRQAIDPFVLAKLEEKGLNPAPPADRRTLLRRVYFDLVGLPPPPNEVDAFLQDATPDALERVVDRLLASPHFGERWGRHWLDLVRYAETRGHEFDYPAPNAYQYRDYVIRALNGDVPYDQFAMEHIAGDLLEQPRLDPIEGFNESLLGTGFWFLGEEVHSPVDIRQDQADRFDNRIDVMTKTFLGLTVACARCHDHKFDAISTKDYYALFGILESSSYRLARFDSLVRNRQITEDLWKLREQARRPLQQALAEDVRPGLDRLAEYLLAAREITQSRERESAVQRIAQARRLDATLLERWSNYLGTAVKNPDDPFHSWARVATDPKVKDSQPLADILHPLHAKAAQKGVDVVIDYAKTRPADWLPDDVTFGPGPVRPGEFRVAGSRDQPAVSVVTTAAAEKDAAWDRLQLAPGVENDPGALSGLLRAGRTIRTPTFTLTGGKLYYRVKGRGQAYAAVDQHALIAGPLHAQLIIPIQAGDRFQWVAHDLTPYKGQRLHIEFTAAGSAEFAVALVVQAATTPASVDLPNRLVLQLLDDHRSRSLEQLAVGYQRLMQDTADRLAEDRLIEAPEAAEYALLANWLIQRRELLDSRDCARRKRFAQAAGALLQQQTELLARAKAESRLAMAMLDGTGVDECVFLRGSHKTPGDVVPRRFLEALVGPDRLAIAHGSGRLQLARQMIDPAVNPFIARVAVNRVWHHLFGRGIVASVDNFGVLGERPSHPELLDFLAGQFIREGWCFKRLIRSLVLSSTYRMASKSESPAEQVDSQNVLVHRMPVRRLEGEAIRDAMLAVSGRLDDRLYGPSVSVHLSDFQDGRGKPASGPLDGDGRRSVYLAVRRNFLSPFLLAFDTPIPFSTVGRRTVSNVPAQALMLMNDPFVHQQAELWGHRIASKGGSVRDRIKALYCSAFSRPPSAAELQACVDFLDRQAELGSCQADHARTWTDLAHVLLNAKEFIFIK
jgi:hypothetical protein